MTKLLTIFLLLLSPLLAKAQIREIYDTMYPNNIPYTGDTLFFYRGESVEFDFRIYETTLYPTNQYIIFVSEDKEPTDSVITNPVATITNNRLVWNLNSLDTLITAGSYYLEGGAYDSQTNKISTIFTRKLNVYETLAVGVPPVAGHSYPNKIFVAGLGWVLDHSTMVTNDAPSDGNEYVRKNGVWTIATGGGADLTQAYQAIQVNSNNIDNVSNRVGVIEANYLQDAPTDGNEYVRKNGSWAIATGGGADLTQVHESIQNNSNDVANLYVIAQINNNNIDNVSNRVATLESAGYITDAPSDGSEYVRLNGGWSIASGGGSGGAYLIETNGAITPINSEGTTNVNTSGNALWSVIGGGGNNTNFGSGYTVIGGGAGNYVVRGGKHFIGGGSLNRITGLNAFNNVLGGGLDNYILGDDFNVIGGGQGNYIEDDQADHMFIGGGNYNSIRNGALVGSTIGGGRYQYIFSDYAFNGGGYWQVNRGHFSSVVGGTRNNVLAGADKSSVLGGAYNTSAATNNAVLNGRGLTNAVPNSVAFQGVLVNDNGRGDPLFRLGIASNVLWVSDITGTWTSTWTKD